MFNAWPIVLFPYCPYTDWPEYCPFQYGHITTLADAGLLDGQINTWEPSQPAELCCEYFGARFVAERPSLHHHRYVLTQTGADLFDAVAPPAGLDDGYYQKCVSNLESQGWKRDEASEFRRYTLPEGQESLFDGSINETRNRTVSASAQ